MNLSNKKIFVYGIGRTGASVILSLSRSGAFVYVWDDKTSTWPDELKGISNVEICSPELLNWQEIDMMVKSPGISYDCYAVKKAQKEGVDIVGDIDILFEKEKQSKFIGITGTNGKSTTTALIGHLLTKAGVKNEVGGNFGIPVLSLPSIGEDGVYVLELSSYQLEMMKTASFDVAIFLNLTPDHLDRHGSMENYLNTKKNIFNLQKDDAVRILGVDNKETKQLAIELKKQPQKLYQVSFGKDGADVVMTDEGKLKILNENDDYETILNFYDFENLPGKHNWQNIACAYLATKNFMDKKTFIAGLKEFTGLPHRLEIVHKIKDILFINDSKATNATAANCALSSYKNIYWIAGGLAKEEGAKPCLSELENVRGVFLFGDAQDRFSDELQSHIPVFKCNEMEKAIMEAYTSAKQEGLQNPVVLLSPACASFDQFTSFEHRGDVFANICRELEDTVNESI